MQISVAFSAAALVCGCTTGVYFVSERPAPEGDGIYRYKASDGSDVSLGPTYQGGRTPHIALDGALLYVTPVGGTNQVFRGTQQLTTSPGDKGFPRWSPNWLAFEQTVSGVRSVVLRSHNGATEFTLATGVEAGLAFFNAGQRVAFAKSGVAFAKSGGIHWADAASGAVATLIENCPVTTPISTCHLPTVSHDGTMLAYRVNVPTGPGSAGFIRILRVGTWTLVGSIARTALDNAVPGESTASLGSFEFSPDDEWLYAGARARMSWSAHADTHVPRV